MKVTSVARNIPVSYSKMPLTWPGWFVWDLPDSKIPGRFNEVNSQSAVFQEPHMTQYLLQFSEKTSQSCNCTFS